ncbi:MAG: hypothetical protein V1837_05835 [Candidatus Woesearchaeota archaeon]
MKEDLNIVFSNKSNMGVKKNLHITLIALSLLAAWYFFAVKINQTGALFLVAAFLLMIFKNQFYDLIS